MIFSVILIVFGIILMLPTFCGFCFCGICKNSPAAHAQSRMGDVEKDGCFALFTSCGMKGWFLIFFFIGLFDFGLGTYYLINDYLLTK